MPDGSANHNRLQRTLLAPRAPQARARLTNGTKGTVLPGIDQRSAVARRFRDICSAIASDQGGPDQLSEVRLQLTRRFAAAAVIAETMEAELARGKQIDVMKHAVLTSTMVRVARRIGINRVPKNVTPDLRDYIEARAQPEPEEAEP
jgi:hypothetical protein